MNLDLTAYYILTQDIDCSSVTDFDPLGTLIGSLDGSDYIISNLIINKPSQDKVGLFEQTEFGSVIINVHLENVNIIGNDLTGSFSGFLRGILLNSSVNGSVTGARTVGGIAGVSAGTISTSFAEVNVTGTDFVGGLVGDNQQAIIQDSYSFSYPRGNNYVGGIAGHNGFEGIINNTYYYADMDLPNIQNEK